MRRRLVAVTATLAMVLTASPAIAYPSPDTLLQAGYDSEEMRVYYTVSDYEEVDSADAEDGAVEVAYEVEVDVEGPEGQLNHGTVVSAVVASLLEQGYTGIGCLVRHFAQTDWGKETGEDGEESVEPADTELLLLEVTTACKHGRSGTVAADADAEDGDDETEGNGRPAWAGPPTDNEDHPANKAGAAGKGGGRP